MSNVTDSVTGRVHVRIENEDGYELTLHEDTYNSSLKILVWEIEPENQYASSLAFYLPTHEYHKVDAIIEGLKAWKERVERG